MDRISKSNTNKISSYYEFDIVKIYNDYKMVIVPEEICDLPSIGFIEAIACGCVYVGINSPMYSDIGMEPNIHYIAYNGTIEDLEIKIKFYQSNQNLLDEIQINSITLFNLSFKPEIVFDKFYSDLQYVMKNRNSKEAKCSFRVKNVQKNI